MSEARRDLGIGVERVYGGSARSARSLARSTSSSLPEQPRRRLHALTLARMPVTIAYPPAPQSCRSVPPIHFIGSRFCRDVRCWPRQRRSRILCCGRDETRNDSASRCVWTPTLSSDAAREPLSLHGYGGTAGDSPGGAEALGKRCALYERRTRAHLRHGCCRRGHQDDVESNSPGGPLGSRARHPTAPSCQGYRCYGRGPHLRGGHNGAGP